MTTRMLLGTLAALLLLAAGVRGEEAPAFDPEAATTAYLARQPPDEKARSDAYLEGRYWLRLWGFPLP